MTDTAMKIYKEMCYIETFDWEVFPVDSTIQQINEMLNTMTFINIWEVVIKTSNIKKAYKKNVDEIENIILNITDTALREKLKREIKLRDEKWFTTTPNVVKSILERLTSK